MTFENLGGHAQRRDESAYRLGEEDGRQKGESSRKKRPPLSRKNPSNVSFWSNEPIIRHSSVKTDRPQFHRADSTVTEQSSEILFDGNAESAEPLSKRSPPFLAYTPKRAVSATLATTQSSPISTSFNPQLPSNSNTNRFDFGSESQLSSNYTNDTGLSLLSLPKSVPHSPAMHKRTPSSDPNNPFGSTFANKFLDHIPAEPLPLPARPQISDLSFFRKPSLPSALQNIVIEKNASQRCVSEPLHNLSSRYSHFTSPHIDDSQHFPPMEFFARSDELPNPFVPFFDLDSKPNLSALQDNASLTSQGSNLSSQNSGLSSSSSGIFGRMPIPAQSLDTTMLRTDSNSNIRRATTSFIANSEKENSSNFIDPQKYASIKFKNGNGVSKFMFLFTFGIVFPPLWILASFLPIPRTKIHQMRVKHVHWRIINRVVACLGVAITFLFIGLGVSG
ncbi:hypothetical protein POMI540_1560 [Schizosaccharomyces pombe]